jgi:hypothetical protein
MRSIHLRPRLLLIVLVAGAAAAWLRVDSARMMAAQPKFYPDDPVWVSHDRQDASGAKPWEIDLITNVLYNLFANPGDKRHNVRAQNLNTVDEVSDSNWFTNRAGLKPITAEDVARGPDVTDGPAAGSWTVTASKSDGVTPGFTIRDERGVRWFLKFDPKGYRGMATGTEVAVTKLMWALGYFVAENHVASLDRRRLVIGEGARFTPPGGEPRPMRPSDIDDLLSRANRDADGTYRVVASKAVEGTPLGGFRFHDTRPDDPNDLVPHEHRRELRGYLVFAAWLNQFDVNAINSLDTLIDQDGHKVVRHNLIDFGSTLGSGGASVPEYWEGYEHVIQTTGIWSRVAKFGFDPPAWRTIELYEAPSIGRFPKDNRDFDPDAWQPRVPNGAFRHARADDKFWGAQKLAAMSDEMIKVAVAAGQFGDPPSEAFLARALAERRDAIVRKYLPAVNPVADPVLDESATLSFRNAAVDARVAAAPADGYRARWFRFDNATGQSTLVGETTGNTRMPAPAELPASEGVLVKVEVTGAGSAPAPWQKPVIAYFQRLASGWRLIGFERMPETE